MLLVIHTSTVDKLYFYKFLYALHFLDFGNPVIFMSICYSKIQYSGFFVFNRNQKLNSLSKKLSSMLSNMVELETNRMSSCTCVSIALDFTDSQMGRKINRENTAL